MAEAKELIKDSTPVKDGKVFADYRTLVRYGETDAMHVAYYANYAVWFEAGRGAYGRATGLSYREFEEEGFYAVVAELYVRYIRPVRFAEEIIIRTWIDKVSSRTMTFKYEIYNAQDLSLCVTGYTKHICTTQDGRVTKLPPNWLAAKEWYDKA